MPSDEDMEWDGSMPYNTAAWQRLRANQLALHPLCVYCQREGMVVLATVCDHITPHRGDIDLFWDGPFQSLCKHCHDSVKQYEEKGGKVVGLDGWPR